MRRWFVVTLIVGCGLQPVEPWDSDDPDSDTQTEASDPGISGLGDPLKKIAKDPPCEEFENADGSICRDVEGATTLFVADVANEDDRLSGKFYYVHYPNQAWRDTPTWKASDAVDQERCLITWTLTGTLSDLPTGPCPDCDWGITYDLVMDMAQTDCPAGKVAELRAQVTDAEWAIGIDDDGQITGWDTQQAWATHGAFDRDEGFVLWSDGACEWYGSGECT